MLANRKSRPSLGSRRASGPGVVGKILLGTGGVAILAIIVVLVGYGVLSEGPVALQENGCPVDRPPSSKVVVLIDQTDTFSAVQAVDIENQFNAVKQSIPRYGELVIYTIKESLLTLPVPVARACNPGNAHDVDRMTESIVRAENTWRESFDEPFRRVLTSVLNPSEASASPIIETIQAVTVAEFGPVKLDQVPKRLVLISDLLQHSKAMSHYSGDVDFVKFENSPVYRRLKTDLRDVAVEILYLNRTTKRDLQTVKHREFWYGLLENQNARIERFYSVSG